MDDFILALDQGTTSSRAILFDRQGQARYVAQREFRQHFPQPGWVEHDAIEIWETQLQVAREVLHAARISAGQVSAIGLANQRETTVIWDRRTGIPIAPAIVWQDRRTAELCADLKASGYAELFHKKTGLLLDPYFSGTKLRWLLDHIPGTRARATRGELAFGTIDSWLAFNLCGRHVTDPSNASRTLLFNIHTLSWDEELLDLLDIPARLLPEVIPTSGLLGHTRPEWLGEAVPIASLVGDQQAACFGQACLRPGMAKNTYGTGCFLLLNTGAKVTEEVGFLSSVGWQYSQLSTNEVTYVLEGSVFTAGAVVQWLRDGLGLIRHANEVEALARSVPDSGGVVFIPAFTGLGAPYWDPDARAAVVGITRGTTAGHLARAALQSIAYQVAQLLEAMQKDRSFHLTELRVDGGAARNDLLMQFQADLLGVPVVRPKMTETTALGAAFLAGLATGYWSSEQEVASLWQEDRRFLPALGSSERQAALERWSLAVQASRHYRPDQTH